MDYDGAKANAANIRDAVVGEIMPPWHADGPRGVFHNDRRLSEAEKQTIVRWVAAGAPQGDARLMPPKPVYSTDWEMGKPDAIVSMPETFHVPASGTIEYQYFEGPVDFDEDKWVTAIEIMPGSRDVVHHVIVKVHAKGAKISKEEIASERGGYFAAYVPGNSHTVFPAGFGKRIPAGAKISFQMHYTPTTRTVAGARRSASATACGPTPSTSPSVIASRTSCSRERRAGRAAVCTSACCSTTRPSTCSRSAGPRSRAPRSSVSTTRAATSTCCATSSTPTATS
jgi:hypothetical protein